MKKFLVLILTGIILLTFAACSNGEHGEETAGTTAGRTEAVYIKGDTDIIPLGQPFTEDEIEVQVNCEAVSLKDMFSKGCYVSRYGYYHVLINSSQLDYNYFTLPIIKENMIVGSLTIHRKDDGTVETASINSGYDKNYLLNQILQEYKGENIAMIYSDLSEYAITEDNSVYTIYGNNNPSVSNENNLYESYNKKDNIISDNIFDNDMYYYKID
jgi:hypothetical protein